MTRAAAIVPIKQDGILTIIISAAAPGIARMAANAAVHAAIGLPVRAAWQAITETLNGLSGRIRFLTETSAIMGSRE
jgi:hypothetical protein